MADFHAADLWVAVVPDASKVGPAMEEAGKEAKTKFGASVKGIGDTIHDDLGKAGDKAKETFTKVGTSIKDVFTKAGKDSHESLTTSFTTTGTTIKDIFTKAGKEGAGTLTDSFSKAGADAATSLTSKFAAGSGPLKDVVNDLGKQLGTKLGGAIGDGLKNIPGADKIVSTFQDAKTKLDEAKTTAKDLAGIFEGMPGALGKIGPMLESWAPALALALQAAKDIDEWGAAHVPGDAAVQAARGKGMPAYSQSIANELNLNMPGANATVPGHPGPSGVNMGGIAGIGAGSTWWGAGGDVLGSNSDAYDAFSSGRPLPGGPGAAPSGNASVPLTQNPDGTWTSPNPAWKHLITRESGGDPGIKNNYDSNAQAGDPSQGLFQFTRATWARSGGLKYGRDPGKATPQQQAEIAANLIRANPSGSDWGAGMSGRESASGLLSGVGPGGATSAGWWGTTSSGGGGSPGSDPSPTYSGSSGGGGGGGGFSGGGGSSGGGGGSGSGAPSGTQNDPLYVIQAGTGGAPGGPGGGGAGGAGDAGAGGDPMGDASNFLSAGLSDAGLGNVLSPFGSGKSPMSFGSTKLLTGLLGMIPHPGAAASAGVAPGPGGAAPAAPGNTTIIHGDVNSGLSVTQNGVQSPTSDLQGAQNAAAAAAPIGPLP